MFDDITDRPSMMPLPDAGKGNFSEILYTRKFLNALKKLHKGGVQAGQDCLRTHEKEWYVFDGKAWALTKRAVFESLALTILPESLQEIKNARAVLDHAQMRKQLLLNERFMGAIRFHSDEKSVLINCNNGVLRVEAEKTKLTPHDPEQLFTGCLPANWDEKAEAPTFQKTMEEALPEVHDRGLLQWFCGYILYPSCMHEVFLISHGPGGTGKSTVSDGVMAVLGGKPMKTVLSLSQVCAEGQGAYSLPSLQYAMVNMGTELDTVDIGDSANFKRIVSGEAIEVRPIYGDPYTMSSYTTKLWFNSNSLPRFRHGTDAELRRARFLEFIRVPKTKDVTLKERLAGERDGIFRWMVNGLQCIMNGAACPEGGMESKRVKERFAISNDPVSAFAKERLDFNPKHEVKKDDIYEAFGEFLSRWGFAEKSRVSLFRQFYERFPEVQAHRQFSDKTREDGTTRTAGQWLLGVALKPDPEDGDEEGQ